MIVKIYKQRGIWTEITSSVLHLSMKLWFCVITVMSRWNPRTEATTAKYYRAAWAKCTIPRSSSRVLWLTWVLKKMFLLRIVPSSYSMDHQWDYLTSMVLRVPKSRQRYRHVVKQLTFVLTNYQQVEAAESFKVTLMYILGMADGSFPLMLWTMSKRHAD